MTIVNSRMRGYTFGLSFIDFVEVEVAKYLSYPTCLALAHFMLIISVVKLLDHSKHFGLLQFLVLARLVRWVCFMLVIVVIAPIDLRGLAFNFVVLK